MSDLGFTTIDQEFFFRGDALEREALAPVEDFSDLEELGPLVRRSRSARGTPSPELACAQAAPRAARTLRTLGLASVGGLGVLVAIGVGVGGASRAVEARDQISSAAGPITSYVRAAEVFVVDHLAVEPGEAPDEPTMSAVPGPVDADPAEPVPAAITAPVPVDAGGPPDARAPVDARPPPAPPVVIDARAVPYDEPSATDDDLAPHPHDEATVGRMLPEVRGE
jgi:hypothetical protein